MRAPVLAVAILCACGKSHSKPPPATRDVPAAQLGGTVIEAEGDVAMQVGAETFSLAPGAKVPIDAVVDTGPAGRVVIELAKNHARWELTANQHQKVTDSIAWKLPDNAGNANVVIRDNAGLGQPPDPAIAAGAKEIERAIEPRKADLVKCLGEVPKATVTIDTGPNGLAGLKFKGGTRDTSDCMVKVLQTIAMPKLVAHAVVPITK